MRSLAILLTIVGVVAAQYEAGHVKILQDQRYQEGGAFGNYRDQEDGIKYQEETDQNGIRRGFWEYPDETGRILRTEFEAGKGIGFRITKSNYLSASVADNSVVQPAPVQRAPQPQLPPVQRVPQPQLPPVQRVPQPQLPPVQRVPQPQLPPVQRVPQPQPLPIQHVPFPTTTTPRGPINLFDYPANLDFSRHAHGHSFKFSAA